MELRTKLAAHGFKPSHADPSLFVKYIDDGKVIAQILVYVDDRLVAAKTGGLVTSIVSISRRFGKSRT